MESEFLFCIYLILVVLSFVCQMKKSECADAIFFIHVLCCMSKKRDLTLQVTVTSHILLNVIIGNTKTNTTTNNYFHNQFI